jgi:hypothetical protein
MQLRGSVKTLTVGTTVTTFNADGNIASIVNPYQSQTLSYSNGKLVSVSTEFNQQMGMPALRSLSTSTKQYEYSNGSKFIPTMNPFISRPFWLETTLVQGLSAEIQDNFRIDYVFHGADLWVISSNKSENVWVPNDTAVVTYSGDYPTHSTSEHGAIQSVTYSDNHCFSNLTVQFFETSHVYTFLADDKYMLASTIVTSYPGGTPSTSTYTYNSHKDIQTVEQYGTLTEYEYEYDSHDNWTSCRSRYKQGETWSDYQTETRSLTYY